MNDYKDRLMKRAEKFSQERGIAMTTLGFKIANDGKFFGRLANDGGCTMDTYFKAMEWFDENE